jgi:hypothetical protein
MQLGYADALHRYKLQPSGVRSWCCFSLTLVDLNTRVYVCTAWQAYASSYLSSCHLEALCTGNVDQGEVLALVQQLTQQLGGGAALPIGARPQEACTRVPAGARLLYREPTKNLQEDNSAVELYLQVCGGALGVRGQ